MTQEMKNDPDKTENQNENTVLMTLRVMVYQKIVLVEGTDEITRTIQESVES